MSREFEAENSVVRAFADFRQEMDRLFDEQIARIRVVQQENGAAGQAPPANDEAPARAWSAILPLPPAVATARPRASSRAAVAAKAPMPAAPVLKCTAESPSAELANANPADRNSDDSRQRLDALARHLDDRLRRARESVAERPRSKAGV